MTVFIDASALVAFIAGEVEQASVGAIVESDPDPLWSAMTCWEAVAALRHSYDLTIAEARDEIQRTATAMELRMIRIDRDELNIALDAFERYGKGQHPAKLNMGDCFAYGCAKANYARLIYKGGDFALTDLA